MVAVLGATGTIGRGIVQALIESGRTVVAVAVDSAQLAELSAANSRAHLTVLAASVTSDTDAGRLANSLRDLGRVIDAVVIAPSGVSGRGRLLDHPTDRLQRALEQDLLPQLAIARALLPLLGQGGRGGRYLIVVGPGSERAWAGYGYRSVTTAALRMLGLVLHDEARSLGVRVQLLAIDSPVGGEPRSPHECGEWPSALAVGQHAVKLIEGNPAVPTPAVAHFDKCVDSSTPHATTNGRAFTDVRSFLKTLTAQR
jgi:NAD(P)-dependent dehydrogenase (short-subunit alcohol dehydrogenase family)